MTGHTQQFKETTQVFAEDRWFTGQGAIQPLTPFAAGSRPHRNTQIIVSRGSLQPEALQMRP